MWSFTPSDRWRVGAKFLYASGSPRTPVVGSEQVDGEWCVVRGPKNSARYPDHHMLDVRIDRTFQFANWKLMAYLDLWSVYGRRNVALYSFSIDDDGTVIRTVPHVLGGPAAALSAGPWLWDNAASHMTCSQRRVRNGTARRSR